MNKNIDTKVSTARCNSCDRPVIVRLSPDHRQVLCTKCFAQWKREAADLDPQSHYIIESLFDVGLPAVWMTGGM